MYNNFIHTLEKLNETTVRLTIFHMDSRLEREYTDGSVSLMVTAGDKIKIESSRTYHIGNKATEKGTQSIVRQFGTSGIANRFIAGFNRVVEKINSTKLEADTEEPLQLQYTLDYNESDNVLTWNILKQTQDVNRFMVKRRRLPLECGWLVDCSARPEIRFDEHLFFIKGEKEDNIIRTRCTRPRYESFARALTEFTTILKEARYEYKVERLKQPKIIQKALELQAAELQAIEDRKQELKAIQETITETAEPEDAEQRARARAEQLMQLTQKLKETPLNYTSL